MLGAIQHRTWRILREDTMNLLLTGATGFVGRNTLLEALPRYSVSSCRCAARPNFGGSWRWKTSRWWMTKSRPLPAGPAEWPDAAGGSRHPRCRRSFPRSREEYFSTNVDWKLRVLRQLPATCKVPVLSFSISRGPTLPGQLQRTDSDPDTPITWYGESKLAMERAIRRMFPDRFINILRPPMVLGARDAATLPLVSHGPRRRAHQARLCILNNTASSP